MIFSDIKKTCTHKVEKSMLQSDFKDKILIIKKKIENNTLKRKSHVFLKYEVIFFYFDKKGEKIYFAFIAIDLQVFNLLNHFEKFVLFCSNLFFVI